MIQISLAIKPNWELLEITNRFPSLTISLWCNFDTDFYELRISDEEESKGAISTFLEQRKRIGFTLRKTVETGRDSRVIIMRCNHTRRGSPEQLMEKFNCMPLMPLVYRRGWVRISGLCMDDGSVPGMLERLGKLGELRVERKSRMNSDLNRENLVVPTKALVSSLTKKQAESILVALDYGYYNVPRRSRFEQIAGAIGVPRSTYEEHVRKAENKIIEAVAPYLEIYFGKE